MTHHELPHPIRARFFTTGTKILLLLSGIGAAFYLYRLIFGIGAATNLDDQYPWGIWISIDVASGVALAAGGFTTAALAEIFHRDKYHAVVRPALLTAMLGYTFVVIGLLADLGRYYNVWHPVLPSMWQGNSVLFEVGMCVMVYLTVLYIEFMPIVVERFKGKVDLPNPLAWANRATETVLSLADTTLKRVTFLFIIAGVVLSCLHQSSLGALMVIAKQKMHPLWWSPMSPLMFLLSAIAVGYPMVIVESLSASRSFKLPPERGVLSSLAKVTPILLGLYLAVKIVDLTLRGAWPYVFEGSLRSFMWLIEMLGGVIIPLIMTANPKTRQNMTRLFAAALMVVFGVVLNRINVFLVAYQPLYPVKTYFPSIMEVGVTVGLASALILVYRWFVMTFPVIAAPQPANTVRDEGILSIKRSAVSVR